MPSASHPLGFARAESLTLCAMENQRVAKTCYPVAVEVTPPDLTVWASYVETLHHTVERSFILSRCAQSLLVPDSVTPWTGAHWAPLSMKFSKQE